VVQVAVEPDAAADYRGSPEPRKDLDPLIH